MFKRTAGVITGALAMVALVASPAFATATDAPGMIDDAKTQVTGTFIPAVVLLVGAAILFWLGVRWLRKGTSQAH